MDNEKGFLREFRSDKGSHLAAALVGLPLMGLSLAVCLTKPNALGPLLFGSFFGFFPQIWLRGFHIWIYEDHLDYTTLFSGRRSIEFRSITKAEIKIGMNADNNKSNVYYGLYLYDAGEFKKSPLVINMKPFTREGLAETAKTIVDKAPQAKFDKRVLSLSRADMTSIQKEGIAQLYKVVLFLLILFFVLGLFGVIKRWFE